MYYDDTSIANCVVITKARKIQLSQNFCRALLYHPRYTSIGFQVSDALEPV